MSDIALASILVGSAHVEHLRAWYRRAFDVSENDMGAFELGPVQLFVEEHSEVSGRAKEPARVIVNLDVDDCRGLAAHLRELGAHFVRPLEEEPFGLIATVEDPDGNYLQIIEWGASPESHAGT